MHAKEALSRLLSGATEKHSPYGLEILSSYADSVTAMCGQKSKRAKLAVLSTWEGFHTLSPPLASVVTLASHGSL